MNNIILIPYIEKYNYILKKYTENMTQSPVITYKIKELEDIINNYVNINNNIHINIIYPNINIKDITNIKEKIITNKIKQINFITIENNLYISIKNIYKLIKKTNNKINILKYIYNLVKIIITINIMDNYENYYNKNFIYKKNNSIELDYLTFNKKINNSNLKIKNLIKIIKEYQQNKRKINLLNDKNNNQEIINNIQHILLINTSYSSLLNDKSSLIEKKLIKNNIKINKLINIKNIHIYKMLNKILKIEVNTEKISNYINKKNIKINGIIYIKEPFKSNLFTKIKKLCKEKNIPLLEININEFNKQENNKLNIYIEMIKYKHKR